MDAQFSLWLFAVSLGASALGGMLGMASGIFIVPILTMFGHVEIHKAIGASIISVIACSCGGAAPFLRSRLTNVRLAIVLEMATTLGALTGVLVAGVVPVSYLFFLFDAGEEARTSSNGCGKGRLPLGGCAQAPFQLSRPYTWTRDRL